MPIIVPRTGDGFEISPKPSLSGTTSSIFYGPYADSLSGIEKSPSVRDVFLPFGDSPGFADSPTTNLHNHFFLTHFGGRLAFMSRRGVSPDADSYRTQDSFIPETEPPPSLLTLTQPFALRRTFPNLPSQLSSRLPSLNFDITSIPSSKCSQVLFNGFSERQPIISLSNASQVKQQTPGDNGIQMHENRLDSQEVGDSLDGSDLLFSQEYHYCPVDDTSDPDAESSSSSSVMEEETIVSVSEL